MPEMDVAMTGTSEERWQEHTHSGCIHGGNRIAQSHVKYGKFMYSCKIRRSPHKIMERFSAN